MMMISCKKFQIKFRKIVLPVSFLFFLINTLLAGNDPVADYQHYREKYPNDNIIKVHNDREVEIKVKNGKPEIKISDYDENFYLQLTPYSGTDELVYYSNLNPLTDLNAFSLIPDKKSYKKLKINHYDTIDYRSPNVFHDDDKALKFNFMGLVPGSKTILEATHQLQEPYLISPFFFNNFISTESAVLQVTFPKSMKIGYKIYNDKDLNIKMITTGGGNLVTYIWTGSDLNKLKQEEDDPGSLYYQAHIFIYIKEFTDEDGNVHKMAENIDDIYKWYYSNISSLNPGKTSPELRKLVDSLTYTCSDTLSMIRQIDYWVQDNISYIAFESGYEAYKPHSADSVLVHRYGDCKGMANLLYTMLTLKGIKAYLTWIGTNELPYSYRDLPHPGCSNHMIVTVKTGGRDLFLDATMRPRPVELASSGIQGKEALVGINSSRYEILQVPVTPTQKNYISDSVHLMISNGQISGKGTLRVAGYLRHDLASSLIEKTQDKQKEYLSKYLQKGNNTFEVKIFEIYNLNDRDKDIIVNYDFDLHEYLTKVDNELFVNINLIRIKEDKLMNDDRKLPYSTRFGWDVKEIVSLEIPEGYEVSELPANDQYEGGMFGFRSEYTRVDKSIVLHFTYFDDYLFLYADRFKDWNQMINRMRTNYAETITLKKK